MTSYLLILVMLLATAAGQVFFKHYHVSGRRISLVLAIGLFVAVVPLTFLAVKQLGLATVYIFMSLSYGLVAFMGWKLFDERVNARQVSGIMIVMLGCLIYNL